MNLNFSINLARGYSNNSQRARVLTEDWVLREIYCPNCGTGLGAHSNNQPVADFYCSKCSEDFELKSKQGKFGKKVSSGAYSQMIKRINSLQKPHFFFMGYHGESLSVRDFFIVPKYFFVPEVVEKRRPLADTARRAGWVGSNILFSKIPKAGQIFYVESGIQRTKNDVLGSWQKTVFLKQIRKVEAKGWVLDIMNCIDDLSKSEFTLQDMYTFEEILTSLHPENKHIKDKIRQQLQILRDKGYLEFTAPGRYRLI